MKARHILFVAIAILLSACRNPSEVQSDRVDQLSGSTMGTLYHVRLGTALSKEVAAGLKVVISERLANIESSMSTYQPDSTISRFNASRSSDWFAISREFAQVVESAQEISRLTGGAFDITVGPLVELWGFGPAAGSPGDQSSSAIPSPDQIAATRAATGFTHLEVRLDPPALRKLTHPQLQIDLSGIAKGFAVDAVAELLEARKISSYLVEIGGEVRVGNSKPDGSSWRVGIEAPVENERTLNRILTLTNTALATSGDYRNLVVLDGQTFSHILDPRTGRPVSEIALGSVSILAPTCQFADAMATALFVLGPGEGPGFAERRKLSTLFLVRQEDGFSARVTDSFEKMAGDPTQWTGN
jgi:thiamine biosynthesis lipoprotein